MKFIMFFTAILINLNATTIELSGTIISDNEKYITSKFMGFVKNMSIKEAQVVKKGDLLYEIDSSELDSKKQQLNLLLQINQNQYENTKRNYERYSRLYEKGLISKYEVEQLELSTNTLRNTIKISETQIKEIEEQYKYLKILAPNDGVIIKKNIKTGEMLIPGTTTLILSDLSDLVVKTEINESYINTIFIGQEVDLYIDSLEQSVKGRIATIIPNLNSISHTFQIKISINNIKYLYPGMYTKIKINL